MRFPIIINSQNFIFVLPVLFSFNHGSIHQVFGFLNSLSGINLELKLTLSLYKQLHDLVFVSLSDQSLVIPLEISDGLLHYILHISFPSHCGHCTLVVEKGRGSVELRPRSTLHHHSVSLVCVIHHLSYSILRISKVHLKGTF